MKKLFLILFGLVALNVEAQTVNTNSLTAAQFIIYALPNTNWNASYVRVTPLGFNFNRRLQLNCEVWRTNGIIDRKVITMPPVIIRQWCAVTNDTPKRFLARWIMAHPDMESISSDQTAVDDVAVEE